MSHEEILQKETLKTADLCILFDVGRSKASAMMRAIKSVQDSFNGLIQGRCHIDDYKAFLRYNKEQSKKRRLEREELTRYESQGKTN